MNRTIPVFNIRDFGAVGDGSADDTAAIQAALDAAPPGATVWFPPPDAYYRVLEPLTVERPMTLVGDGAELRLETEEMSLLVVTSNDVTIRGLKLVGPQFDSISSDYCSPEKRVGESGIDAHGNLWSARISGLRVKDNEIRSFGGAGIHLHYVECFQISGNRIDDIYYKGVEILSSRFGIIAQNRIRNIIGLAEPGPGAYGIGLARCETDSLETDPRCTDVTVSGNVVEDVPHWKAYDTHGGQRISFLANTARGTRIGIGVVGSDATGQVTTWAPLDVTVVGNVLDSGVTDGSAGVGMLFTGASGNPPLEYATGVISSNVLRGYGDQSNGNSAAIRVHTTRGLQVVGNTLIEPSPVGMNLENDNQDATVVGNTIIDAWTDTLGTTIGILVQAPNNVVHIGDNTIGCGDKIATLKCVEGVRLNAGSEADTNEISLGVNSVRAVVTPLVNPGRGSARLAMVECVTSSNTSPVATFRNGGGNGPGVLIQAGSGVSDYAILDVTCNPDAGPCDGISRFLVRGDGRVDIAGGLTISNGDKIDGHVSRTTMWDPGSMADGASESHSVAVPGAIAGDPVAIGFSSIASGGWQVSGQVTAGGTVTVTLTNNTGGVVDLPSGRLRADVWQHLCGNGLTDAGEECDDGNTDWNDGCDEACQSEVCGDAIVQDGIGEACDDGFADDCGTCNADCSGPGSGSTCGDGDLCSQTEQCDDGDGDNSDSCPDGAGGTCLPANCGDGFVWNTDGGTEECDDGNTDPGDGCDQNCLIE